MQSQDLLQANLFFLVRDKIKISELDSLIIPPKGKIVTISSLNESTFLHMNGTRTVVIYAACRTQSSGKTLEVNPESYLDLPKKVLRHLSKQNVIFVHLNSGAVYNPSSRHKAGIPASEEAQVSSTDSYSAEQIILERWSKSVGTLQICSPEIQDSLHFMAQDYNWIAILQSVDLLETA